MEKVVLIVSDFVKELLVCRESDDSVQLAMFVNKYYVVACWI